MTFPFFHFRHWNELKQKSQQLCHSLLGKHSNCSCGGDKRGSQQCNTNDDFVRRVKTIKQLVIICSTYSTINCPTLLARFYLESASTRVPSRQGRRVALPSNTQRGVMAHLTPWQREREGFECKVIRLKYKAGRLEDIKRTSSEARNGDNLSSLLYFIFPGIINTVL